MSTKLPSNLILALLFILSCSEDINLYPDPNTIIQGQQDSVNQKAGMDSDPTPDEITGLD